LRYLLFLILLASCGEKEAQVYKTDCSEIELGEHIGYLSIEGIDTQSYVYWGCVAGDCSSSKTEEYNISVRSLGGDVLRVCCGSEGERVDRVNVVVLDQ